jgi:hypothetical protein
MLNTWIIKFLLDKQTLQAAFISNAFTVYIDRAAKISKSAFVLRRNMAAGKFEFGRYQCPEQLDGLLSAAAVVHRASAQRAW